MEGLGISGRGMKGSSRAPVARSPIKRGKAPPVTDEIGRRPILKNDRIVLNKKKNVVTESKGLTYIPKIKGMVVPKPQTLSEKAQEYLSLPPSVTLGNGSINVRFNHYNKAFPVYNSVLKWADIDEEYACSFVYKGKYRRDIYLDSPDKVHANRTLLTRDVAGDYFFVDASIVAATEPLPYKLELEEDPEAGVGAEGLRLREGPINFTSGAGELRSGNRQVDLITQDLKDLHVKGELQSEDAKMALEARDVEDILFSG